MIENRYRLAERILELKAENERLRKWHEATTPIIAALAIYGERASLPALVAKARELNEANPALTKEQK